VNIFRATSARVQWESGLTREEVNEVRVDFERDWDASLGLDTTQSPFRKARYYEKRHARKADRLIVISPMIDAQAQKVIKRLGVET
jgi:hypothetical protein